MRACTHRMYGRKTTALHTVSASIISCRGRVTSHIKTVPSLRHTEICHTTHSSDYACETRIIDESTRTDERGGQCRPEICQTKIRSQKYSK